MNMLVQLIHDGEVLLESTSSHDQSVVLDVAILPTRGELKLRYEFYEK